MTNEGLSKLIVSSGLFMKHDYSPFKWRHYPSELILLCVRWCCRYQLSYRDVKEMMRGRGLDVNHSTVFRWVQALPPPRLRKVCYQYGIAYLFAARDDEIFAVARPGEIEDAVSKVKHFLRLTTG